MNAAETCPRTEALSALVDDELVEVDRAALDAHVAGCALCAPVLSEFRKLHNNFAALPEVRAGVDITRLVDRRIANLAPSRPKARPSVRWHWWQFAPAAFGGALSLSLGVYLGSELIISAPVTARPAAWQMATFSANPPGALCPALAACNVTGR